MKKMLSILLASTMALSAVSGLVACGDDDDGPNAYLTVWCPGGAKACYQKLFDEYKAAHEEAKDWTIRFEDKGEGDALAALQKDPTTAPEIFMFASDHIGQLMENNFLQKLPADMAADVISRDSEGSVTPVRDGNDIYAFPNVNSNGYFLIYDTEVFSADDVKSLDKMLTKATTTNKILFNYNDGFYAPTFFWGMEVKLGDTSGDYEVTVDSEQGREAAAVYEKYLGTGKFTVSGGNNGFAVSLGKGEACAAIMGTWVNELDQSTGVGYLDALLAAKGWDEDRIGYTKLPMFTDTQGVSHQMHSFMGAKYCGVNAFADANKIADALAIANYFNTEAAQIARFKATQEAPTNKAAAEDEDVKANRMLTALAEQNAAGGHVQLDTPPQFWDALGAFGTAAYNGWSGTSLAAEVDKLDKALKATSAA